MAEKGVAVSVTFTLEGDQFPHAWFYNRFRVDRVGESFFVTLGLLTEAGGLNAVNAVVLGATDHRNNRERTLKYLSGLTDVNVQPEAVSLGLSAPPARVYPINHFNLARIDHHAEVGFYRFSINTLVDSMRTARAGKQSPVKCHPVVMFRSDLAVQLALLKELYSFEDK